MMGRWTEESAEHFIEERRYAAGRKYYLSKPDYTRPSWHFSDEIKARIAGRMVFLYGEELAQKWMGELERICRVHYAHKTPEMIEEESRLDPLERFTEQDVILITYGDLIHGNDPSPLQTLSKFCGKQLQGAINTIHILPFYPHSSDRGFSVIDFDRVDPHLGTWEDIEEMESRYQLMFDGVINHVSSKSRWFQEFLNGHPHYKDYFVSYQSPEELTSKQKALIFRPRTSDVLTPFETVNGTRYVWTTFSQDQVDLNYRNPETLIRVLDVLLHYARRGADIIRLDAVTYLWRQAGTNCIHLPQTHETVKLIRDVLEAVAPHVALITETNVPHAENIAYFGRGNDEAHLVYNFALPPLLLHTMYAQDVSHLNHWAENLVPPSDTTGFLNFLDSHDGMGLLAVRDILSPEELNAMVRKAETHGGLVSYRSGAMGEESPYEVNITWYSALNRDEDGEPLSLQVDRFIATRAIAMALRGIPGIYIHSLFGTKNDRDAVLKTGVKRDINRKTVDYETLLSAMYDPATSTCQILSRLTHLLKIRTKERAFHPRALQSVLDLGTKVFGLVRQSPEGDRTLVAITNVSDQPQHVEIPLHEDLEQVATWKELITGRILEGALTLELPPYGVAWLLGEP